MCLSFNYTAAIQSAVAEATKQAEGKAEREFNKEQEQHSDVSCDGTQIGLLEMTDHTWKQLNRIPISSPSAVIAMLSAPRRILGEKHQNIQPSEPIPCFQADLKAACDPAAYVMPPKRIDAPVYRGLGGPPGKAAQQTTYYPEIKLEEGICLENKDGSMVFTLRLAEVVRSDKKLQQEIDEGRWSSKEQYLLAMKDAAWKEILRAFAANNVDMKALFECTGEKDANGQDVVAPEVVITFMDMFYPCLIPDCDMVVLIPPIVDGKAVMKTAFSLMLGFPERPPEFWAPGLQHNDVGDTTNDKYKQDENYFIYSNAKMSLKLPNVATGIYTDVRLCQQSEFLPVNPHPNWSKLAEESTLTDTALINHFRNMQEDDTDYEAWVNACKLFQNRRHKDINYRLEDMFGKDKMITNSLLINNLLGTEIPKLSTYAVVGEFTPVEGSAHTTKLRELMKKRKNEGGSSDDPPAKRPTPVSDAPDVTDAADVTDVVMQEVEQSTTTEDPMDEAATQMLKAAIYRINTVTDLAVACTMARDMNPDYAAVDATSKDDIKVDIMTTKHKTHLCTMINAVMS